MKSMTISRRQFLKLCGATGAVIRVSGSLIPEIVAALEKAAAGNPPVAWIQGGGCPGCSVSLLNTVPPSIAEVLLRIISLKYHPTMMAASGEKAADFLYDMAEKNKGKYFLAVEGAVVTGMDGKCCTPGKFKGKEMTFVKLMVDMETNAAAVLALSQCGSYGGIPAAKPNPSESMGVTEFFKLYKIKTPVISKPEDLLPKEERPVSLHDIGLLEALDMAKKKGIEIETVVIGVEPKILGWGMELSDELKKIIPALIEVVLRES